MLKSTFNNVAGFQASKFIKKWLEQKCFSLNIVNFLRAAFSVEHLRWLILCLFKRKEEDSVEQRSKEKFFK